jgi:hypothetical protein
MTVRKGEAWGSPGSLPDRGVVVASDAEAASVLEAARREGRPFPPLGLTGGDLCRTLGGRGALSTVVRCDLGEALVDGRLRYFVAHVVVRGRTLWRGSVVGALNAQYVGEWDVAPRSHPGDGKLDVVEVAPAMSLADRWKARRRLPSGTHVPHPAITVRQSTALQLDVAGRRVVIDGVAVPSATSLSIRVEPEAVTVVV